MKLLDTVRLKNHHTKSGLKQGTTGTIVEVFETPSKAFEVEFADAEGQTVAQLTLREDDVELVVSHRE